MMTVYRATAGGLTGFAHHLGTYQDWADADDVVNRYLREHVGETTGLVVPQRVRKFSTPYIVSLTNARSRRRPPRAS